MKVLFVDPIDWDYNLESVYQRPLGGSQSALCYLSEALARRGHQISLLTNTTQPGLYRGVSCMSLSTTTSNYVQSLCPDVCILLNGAVDPIQVRRFIGASPFLVLWTQHDIDQPAIQDLANPAICAGYDSFAFVSHWQRSQYLSKFPLKPETTVVHQNAVSPLFEGLFSEGISICSAKSKPPVLAYTSTPFRGLNILLSVFPEIRKAVPGARLKVFSSMKVYQVSEDVDTSEFGELYRACRETEGVEYCGSVSQPQLAGELRQVTSLAYPNTFAETSCIAVMEAMAAGCGIVTSDLGALSETTAGFGNLLSLTDGTNAYIQKFRDTVITLLQRHLQTSDLEMEELLRRQVDFTNANYTWTQRAEEWETWLTDRIRQLGR